MQRWGFKRLRKSKISDGRSAAENARLTLGRLSGVISKTSIRRERPIVALRNIRNLYTSKGLYICLFLFRLTAGWARDSYLDSPIRCHLNSRISSFLRALCCDILSTGYEGCWNAREYCSAYSAECAMVEFVENWCLRVGGSREYAVCDARICLLRSRKSFLITIKDAHW